MADQFTSDPVEIILSGPTLEKETNDLETINKVGNNLFESNKDFIKQKVKDNWYAVIEPLTGAFIASEDVNKLYSYTMLKYPNKLLYVIGLLRNQI